MLYEFVTPSGRVIEREYPMGKAPGKIGQVVRLPGGVRARRLPPGWSPDDAKAIGPARRGIQCVDVAHEAVFLAKGHPDAPRYSADGFPVFLNKREIREFTAKHPRYRYDT